MHEIDANQLHDVFPVGSFDTIIFQFPHTGSRELIEGHNPNYVLARNFIRSASCVLKKNGAIVLTTIDSEFYNGVFRFAEIGQELDLASPIQYKFDPADYSGYVHTMTHEEGSILDEYDRFITWEFRI
jgi:25S rRNA (uracil2634-N3)-methyltransferase